MANTLQTYQWHQTEGSLTITARLNGQGRRKKEVTVAIEPHSVEATMKGKAIVKGKLFAPVDTDACVWTVTTETVDGKAVSLLEIVLIKKESAMWAVPIKDGIKGDDDMDAMSHFLLSSYLEEKGDYDKALQHLQQAADSGLAVALCRLAQQVRKGANTKLPVQPDNTESLRLLDQAIQIGCSEAWLYKGHHYRYGWGVEKDYVAAEGAYRRVIETTKDKSLAGKALYSVSQLYRDGGPGLLRNEKTMVETLLRASNSDSAEASMELGRLYKKAGGPLPQNEKQALFYFEKANQLDSSLAIPGSRGKTLSPRSRKQLLETWTEKREWSKWEMASTVLTVGFVIGAFYMHSRLSSK